MAFGLAESIDDLRGPIAEEMLPSLQSMRWSFNDSSLDCPDVFCDLFADIGSPPDWLPPPPPLPAFLLRTLIENNSQPNTITSDVGCNFCHVFSDPVDSELVVPKPEFKTQNSSFALLIGSILGSAILCIILLFILIKFRRWKLIPSVHGLDSFFSRGLTRGRKSVTTNCSQSDNYISPVINEKSPQSIITNCPTKTSIPSKYWRRSTDNRRVEDYTNIPSGGCTSSPVYAELDAGGVTVNHSQIPNSLLISGSSPYAVHHTYSEIADAMRMAALGSSNTLFADSSYANVTNLPSNADHYQVRYETLGRQHPTMGFHGSAAPLLSTHQQVVSGSPLNYLTGVGTQKKSRPIYPNQISQFNQIHGEVEPRYSSSRLTEAVYTDFPLSSSSIPTFRVPYGITYRENPKRPLPDVPGVRL